MPLYEAVCERCNRVHEYVASMSDRDVTPMCCGRKTKKQVTAPMLSIYINDAFKRGKNIVSLQEGRQEIAVQRKNRERAQDAKRRKDVERVVRELTKN